MGWGVKAGRLELEVYVLVEVQMEPEVLGEGRGRCDGSGGVRGERAQNTENHMLDVREAVRLHIWVEHQKIHESNTGADEPIKFAIVTRSWGATPVRVFV